MRGTREFDFPPGYSRRWIRPLFDREIVLAELTDSLRGRVRRVQVAGTSSGAHSGESFEILLIVLGLIGSGVLSAIGEDIWKAVKKAVMRSAKRGPRRAMVEVAIEFEECDVVLHAESRTRRRYRQCLTTPTSRSKNSRRGSRLAIALPQGAETVEVRRAFPARENAVHTLFVPGAV